MDGTSPRYEHQTRRGAAQEAFDGYRRQIDPLPSEPGIRRQL